MKFIKICAIKKTVSTFNVHNKQIQEIKQHCYYYQNLIKKPSHCDHKKKKILTL